MSATDPEADVTVKIDGLQYRVRGGVWRAVEIRQIPHPPIGGDRDVWLRSSDGPDFFLVDEAEVDLSDGQQMYTAPRAITAG